MKYTYYPLERRVKVEFDVEVPYNLELFEAQFTWASPITREENGQVSWIGVYCDMLEWLKYLEEVLPALAQAHPPPPILLQLIRDRAEYIDWCLQLAQTPFLKNVRSD